MMKEGNTMLADKIQTETISLTPAAVQAVRDLLEKRNLPGYALRIYVSGAGCSGFQYGMALEGNVREEDLLTEFDGVKVVVDEVSINYLRGASVDYIETEQGIGFAIDNPNMVETCSCGSSDASSGGCSGCS